MKKVQRKRMMSSFLVVLLSLALVITAFSGNVSSKAVQAEDINPTSFSNNKIPVLNIEIDESKGTIADMNNDMEHNTKCYGSMNFSVPAGYISEYGENGIESGESLELDHIKGRGNASWHAGDKKPYKIKLKKKADLFGMGANKHWVLLNATNADYTYMKNKLLYDLAAQIGSNFAPKSIFVDVVMNGEYIGNYLLCEQIRVGKTRVDIDDLDEAKEEEEDTLTGGYLINQDEYAWNAENTFTTKNDNLYEIVSPSLENVTEERKNYITDYMGRFEDAVNAEDFKNEQGEHYGDLMDVDSFVNYFLIQFFSDNFDAFHNSTYMYKVRGGKLYWGPVWDFDHSMSGISNAESDAAISGSSRKLVGQLIKDPEMVQKIWKRYIQIRNKLVTLYQNGGYIDQTVSQMGLSAEKDLEKWCGNYSHYYDEEVEDLKEWIAARILYMDTYLWNLAGSPEDEVREIIKWEKQEVSTYTFSLDAQGGILKGSGPYNGMEMYSDKLAEDTVVSVRPMAVRKGYAFGGWFYDKESTSKVGKEEEIPLNKDITLYAHWIKITVSAPKIAALKSNGVGKANVRLKKVNGAKGYEIMYASNKKFKAAKKKSGSSCSYRLSGLKKGTTYYIKARAYKMDSTGSRVYSSYSSVSTIKGKKG